MLKNLLENTGYFRISLEPTGTDHLALKATLNNKEGLFILDTGASGTCVGMDAAIHFEMQEEETELKAAGAGATEMDTRISENNTLRIGEWQCEGLKIILLDLSHVNTALTGQDQQPVDGIIGADVLRMAAGIIDYGEDVLYLKDLNSGLPPEGI